MRAGFDLFPIAGVCVVFWTGKNTCLKTIFETDSAVSSVCVRELSIYHCIHGPSDLRVALITYFFFFFFLRQVEPRGPGCQRSLVPFTEEVSHSASQVAET